MKLSWLNTSEAHTNNTSIYMIWQYESMHKVRERVRENGSIANTWICFEVRAHSSTSPPSLRRIFTISSTQDFPHREPPLRIWGKYNQEYTTPLSTNTTSTLRGKAQPTQNHLTLEGLGTKPNNNLHFSLEGAKHNLHLSLEGAKHNLHLSLEGVNHHSNNQPLHKRDITNKEGLQLGDFHNHKPNLSH